MIYEEDKEDNVSTPKFIKKFVVDQVDCTSLAELDVNNSSVNNGQ